MLFSMLFYTYPCICCHMNVIFHVCHVSCHQSFFSPKKCSSGDSTPLPLEPKNWSFGFFMVPSSSVHVMTHVHVSGCIWMFIFMFFICHATHIFHMSHI